MSQDIYTGSSQGFSSLCEGYLDYSKEVIGGRSIPDLRDGLKPVGRRCIYGSSLIKEKGFSKCLTLIGEISKYHPHGDSSVYGALAGMVDTNGGMAIAPFSGQGAFGRVYSSAPPAASRYTKAKLSELSSIYLRDISVAKMVLSEEGDGYEPEVLPVRFPVVLVNGATGMAVSVNTMIPSFNALEVIDLTQEFLREGELTTCIAPDFTSGGVLVSDQAEILKLMHVGKGKLKIRAKVEIVGKEIHVIEVPYGKTIESILKAIKKNEYRTIVSAQDASGKNSEVLVKIQCRSKAAVEGTLMSLYKDRVLQSSFSANMLFVVNGEPKLTGVYGTIRTWVAWRRGVVTKMMSNNLDGIKEELTRLDYFIRLVDDLEKKDKFLDLLVHTSRSAASDYLHEVFPDITDDVISWIEGISAGSFRDGGRQRTRYDSLEKDKEYYLGVLNDVDSYILSDLEDVKNLIKSNGVGQRRTLETTVDYRFSKIVDSVLIDDSPCVYTLYSDGFLSKTRDYYTGIEKEVMFQISAKANSTLVGFDCYGRVLRLYGDQVEFTSKGNLEYLPHYFGVDGFDGVYKILYLGLADGLDRMLVYRDGFIGFFNTDDVESTKKIRTIMRGVDPSVFGELVEVIEEDPEKGFPEYLVVADDHGRDVRFAVTLVSDIRRASRKSRAKVFKGDDPDIHFVAGMSMIELHQFLEDPNYYYGRLKNLGKRKVFGDAGEIMKEGRYYEGSRKNRNSDREQG